MRLGTAFGWMAGGYFFWVYVKNGTLPKLIGDFSKGAQDAATGLKQAAQVA